MNPRIPHSFEHALTILLLFLFGNYPGIDNLANIKTALRSIEQHENGWTSITQEVLSRPDRQLIIALSSFLKGLLMFLQNHHSIRLDVDLMLVSSGLWKALKALNYEQGDPILSTLQTIFKQVTDDVTMLSVLFRAPESNPFSNKSICDYMKQTTNPPTLFNSVLLSMFDISGRYENAKQDVMVFLHNFMTITRFYLSQNDTTKLKYAANIAAGLKKPIILPLTAKTYKLLPAHEDLYNRSFFIFDQELATTDIARYLEGHSVAAASSQGGAPDDSNLITMADANAKIAEVKSEMDEQIRALEMQIEDMQTSLKLAKEGKDKLQTSLDEQRNALEQAHKERQAFEQMLAKADTNASSSLDTIKKQLTEALAKLATAIDEKDQIAQQAAHEKDELEARHHQELSELEQKSSDTPSDAIRTELESRAQQIAQAESKNNDLLRRIASLEDTKAEIENDLKQVEEEKASLYTMINTKKGDSRAKEEIEEQLNELKAQHDKELKKLNEQIAQAAADAETKETMHVKQLRAQHVAELSEALVTTNDLQSKVVDLQAKADQLKAAQQKLDDVTTDKANIETQLQNAQTANQRLQAQHDLLKQQHEDALKEAQTEMAQVVQNAQKKEAEQNEKMAQLMRAENDSKSDALLAELHAAQESKSELQTVIEAQKTKLSELQSANSELEMRLSSASVLTNELEAAKQQLAEKAGIESKFQTLQQESLDSSTKLTAVTDELQQTKKMLQEEKKTTGTLQLTIEEMEAKASQAAQALSKSNADHQAAESQIETLKQQVSALKTQLNDAEATNTDTTMAEMLQRELESTKSKLAVKSEKCEELQHELDSTESKVSDITGELTRLMTDNQTYVAQIEKLTQTNTQNSAELEQLRARSAELTRLQEELKSLEPAIKERDTKIAELQKQLDAKEIELADLRIDRIQEETSQQPGNDEEEEEEKPEPLPPLENKAPPVTLRPFIWTPIPDTAVHKSIWDDIRTSPINLDMNDVSRFFKSQAPVLAISPKKLKSASLYLAQVKKNSAAVIKGLYQLADWFTGEQLDVLIELIPTQQELVTMDKFKETQQVTRLEPGSQFLFDLSGVAQIDKRLRFMRIEKDFTAKMARIEKQLTQVCVGASQLKSSQKLRELFSLILKCGNYMNGGTPSGGAYGFTIDTLLLLKDTPSTQPGLMMTHFLALIIDGKFNGINHFLEEMPDLVATRDIDVETITNELEEMSNILVDCMMLMPEAEARAATGDSFFPRFMEFYGQQKGRLDEVKDTCRSTMREVRRMKRLLCFDLDKPLSDAIKILLLFNDDLSRAGAENRHEAPPKPAFVQSCDDNAGVLDSLVSDLQSDSIQHAPKPDQSAQKKDDKKGSFFSGFFK